MSYSATFYLKKVSNKLEAYEFCDKFTKEFLQEEYAKKWIDRNIRFIPEMKFLSNKQRLKDNAEYIWTIERIIEYTNGHWLRNLFTFKFYYWEKCGLVGMIGNLPAEFITKFDKVLDFQSSCSQDYDYEYWGEDIPMFNEIIEKIKEMNLSDLAKKVELSNNIFFEENDNNEEDFYEIYVKENEEYCRKILIYDEIATELEIVECIYDNELIKTQTFAFCVIDTIEKMYHYQIIMNEIAKKYLK